MSLAAEGAQGLEHADTYVPVGILQEGNQDRRQSQPRGRLIPDRLGLVTFKRTVMAKGFEPVDQGPVLRKPRRLEFRSCCHGPSPSRTARTTCHGGVQAASCASYVP